MKPTTIEPQFESKSSIKLPAPKCSVLPPVEDVEPFIARYVKDSKRLRIKGWIVLHLVVLLLIAINGLCVFLWIETGKLQEYLLGSRQYDHWLMDDCRTACSEKLDVVLRGFGTMIRQSADNVTSIYNCRRNLERIHECNDTKGTRLFCFQPARSDSNIF